MGSSLATPKAKGALGFIPIQGTSSRAWEMRWCSKILTNKGKSAGLFGQKGHWKVSRLRFSRDWSARGNQEG